MSKIGLHEFIAELFNYFAINTLNRKKKYILSDKDKKLIDNFLKKFPTAGEEFIGMYFEAQFDYWVYMKESGNLNTPINYLQLNWILGEKAIARFNNTKDFNQYKRSSIRNKGVFSKKLKKSVDKTHYTALIPVEENEKRRHYNTDMGMYWCLNYTFLYNPKSELCKECNFKQDCKVLLKLNFPKIYKIRMA